MQYYKKYRAGKKKSQMEKLVLENNDNLIKKLQDDIKREAISEFNRFRLNILANQIKSKNYGHNANKVSNA